MREVSRVYLLGPEPVTALERVALALPYGSFTGVMGPFNSGKTTPLRCAAGLEQTDASRVVVLLIGVCALVALAAILIPAGMTLLRAQRRGLIREAVDEG